MRPILAAILLGISIAALGGSPDGGGGGGHGGGSSGGSGGGHASGSAHGGGTHSVATQSGAVHVSADAHPGAATHVAYTSLAGALRGWWHHRHEHGRYGTTDRVTLCTDPQRRAPNCDADRSLPER